MKVKLNADWLEINSKSKLLWIQQVRKDFGFTAAQIKPLADLFWSATNNLVLAKELIVDTNEIDILNSLGSKNSFGRPIEIDEVWISFSRAIQHHHTEEEKTKLKYEANPRLRKEEELQEEIQKLMDLIPEDKVEQVEKALKKVLNVHSSLSGPYA